MARTILRVVVVCQYVLLGRLATCYSLCFVYMHYPSNMFRTGDQKAERYQCKASPPIASLTINGHPDELGACDRLP